MWAREVRSPRRWWASPRRADPRVCGEDAVIPSRARSDSALASAFACLEHWAILPTRQSLPRKPILQRDVRAKVAAARAELSARRKGAGRLERMQSTIRRLLDAETEWFALSAAMKRCTAATSARSPLRRRPRGFWSAASVARPSPYATGRPVGSPTREWMDTASTSTPPRARLVRV